MIIIITINSLICNRLKAAGEKVRLLRNVRLRIAAFFNFSLITIFLIPSLPLFSQEINEIEFSHPDLVLANVPFTLKLKSNYDRILTDTTSLTQKITADIHILIDSKPVTDYELKINEDHILIQNLKATRHGMISLQCDYRGTNKHLTLFAIPGILSLLPPILAIILALLVRQVFLSLFCGIWIGVSIINHYNPILGFLRSIDTFLLEALADPSHISIVIFSMTLGGMIGVISKSGGTRGIVLKLSKLANSRRGGLVATWALGIFIFFDDYANTLVVGNTMRPFTDRLFISREKLSYIVDSTAAPVASIAVISSWVGFQVGLIQSTFETLNITKDAYLIFIRSIPYSIYSILTLFFVFLISITLRDKFAMYKAESRAFREHQLISTTAQPLVDTSSSDFESDDTIEARWYNALIPILTVIIATIIGLYFSGLTNLGKENGPYRIGEIIGAANSFDALMWASFLGSIIAMVLAISQKILKLSAAFNSWLSGVKAMVIAMLILTLAWALGDVCLNLHTADYVIESIKSILSPRLLPLITFMTAAFISFSTGTSWATMAILIPIVIPAVIKLTMIAGFSQLQVESILIATIGSVLSGSVFGDHCSPISDTTIMSSMASASDHIDHVRTQLPYAILVASVSCLVGYLPIGYGMNIFLSLSIGATLLIALTLIFFKKNINNRLDHLLHEQ